jgi:hypothetical protein
VWGSTNLVDARRESASHTKNTETQGLDRAVRLFSYVVRWDHGFAPNPFYNLCTVATCKPDIRNLACLGDYVLGTGSAKRRLDGRVVFLMRVEEIITFNQYWNDERLVRKIPIMNGSLQQRFGDNIYYREGQKWMQADSRHSQVGSKPNLRNLKRDTKADRVLISSDFTYWGGEGPRIPEVFNRFIHRTPAYRAFFSECEINEFVQWTATFGQKGQIADPHEWRYEKWWR